MPRTPRPPTPPPVEIPFDDDEEMAPLRFRLSKDLRKAAAELTRGQVRYLVDLYYQIQGFRISAAHEARTSSAAGEPVALVEWVSGGMKSLEGAIRSAMEIYTDARPTSVWAKCAPPGSLVWTGNRHPVPIETLRDGDGVLAFNRDEAGLTGPRPVTVGVRPYTGTLFQVETPAGTTAVTPRHRWLVKLLRKDVGYAVYLMQAGDRFRVGRTMMFHQRGKDFLRWRLQQRARNERAAVWILKLCSTEQEAAVYEEYVAAQYGFTEWPFRPSHMTAAKGYINPDTVAQLFALLKSDEQAQRAARCLADHDRNIAAPLWSWTGSLTVQSGTQTLKTATANLIPELMQIPVPTQRGFDWVSVTQLRATPYTGPVYSLDVAQHHTYVQDGLITCNSICGIAGTLSAGLEAHIDIGKAPTVGHIWRFAGLDPTVTWAPKTKRPWNASLKVLCFKIGESFVKVQNNRADIYGQVFAKRKRFEIERNDQGFNTDRSAAILEAKRFRKDTTARASYESGKLPPAHLHAQARRYAVKLFLSHWHEGAYWAAFQALPPKPYAIEHLGHAHLIAPPHTDLIPGWTAARIAAGLPVQP